MNSCCIEEIHCGNRKKTNRTWLYLACGYYTFFLSSYFYPIIIPAKGKRGRWRFLTNIMEWNFLFFKPYIWRYGNKWSFFKLLWGGWEWNSLRCYERMKNRIFHFYKIHKSQGTISWMITFQRSTFKIIDWNSILPIIMK